MSDEELRIRVTTDTDEAKKLKGALKDISQEVKLAELAFKRQEKSAGDTQITFGELEKKVKALNLSEKDTVNIMTQLYHAENRVTLGFRSLATEVKSINSKMPSTNQQFKDFYREQRVGDRTMRETTQAVSAFTSILGGSDSGLGKAVGGAFQQFQSAEFAVHGLGIAAQTASPRIAGIGATLMANAGPIAAAVAGIGLVAMAMKRASEYADRFNEALMKNREALLDMGRISKEEEITRLTREINKESQKGVSPSWLTLHGGSAMIAADVIAQVLEREANINVLMAERARLEKEIASDREKEAKSAEDIAKSEEANAQASREIARMFSGGAAGMTASGMPEQGGMKIGAVGGAKTPKQLSADFQAEMSKISALETSFEASTLSGMQAVGQSIRNDIGGAFEGVFGEANSLLEIFLSRALGGLGNFLLSAGLNYILPGSSAILGFSGATGGGGASRVNSDLQSTRMTSGRSGGGGSRELIVLGTRISNGDIYIGAERGRVANAKKYMGINRSA